MTMLPGDVVRRSVRQGALPVMSLPGPLAYGFCNLSVEHTLALKREPGGSDSPQLSCGYSLVLGPGTFTCKKAFYVLYIFL